MNDLGALVVQLGLNGGRGLGAWAPAWAYVRRGQVVSGVVC